MDSPEINATMTKVIHLFFNAILVNQLIGPELLEIVYWKISDVV